MLVDNYLNMWETDTTTLLECSSLVFSEERNKLYGHTGNEYHKRNK